MADLKKGDSVVVATRPVTNEDVKTSLYYAYFGGLAGKVDNVYDDGTVCIEVDLDSLPKEARERHLSIQAAENKRWLDNISDEMRNKLSADQKKLTISYKILVNKNDIQSASA